MHTVKSSELIAYIKQLFVYFRVQRQCFHKARFKDIDNFQNYTKRLHHMTPKEYPFSKTQCNVLIDHTRLIQTLLNIIEQRYTVVDDTEKTFWKMQDIWNEHGVDLVIKYLNLYLSKPTPLGKSINKSLKNFKFRFSNVS